MKAQRDIGKIQAYLVENDGKKAIPLPNKTIDITRANAIKKLSSIVRPLSLVAIVGAICFAACFPLGVTGVTIANTLPLVMKLGITGIGGLAASAWGTKKAKSLGIELGDKAEEYLKISQEITHALKKAVAFRQIKLPKDGHEGPVIIAVSPEGGNLDSVTGLTHHFNNALEEVANIQTIPDRKVSVLVKKSL